MIGNKCFTVVDDGLGALKLFLDDVDSIDLGFDGRSPQKTVFQSRIGSSVFAINEKKRLLAVCAVLDVSLLQTLLRHCRQLKITFRGNS